MKIRNGFVSNSSSSSFICEVCGNEEIVSDCDDACDAGMYICVNEHTFCQEHALPFEDGYDVDEELDSKYCPICTLQTIGEYHVLKFVLKSSNLTIEDVKKQMREKFKSIDDLYDYLNK